MSSKESVYEEPNVIALDFSRPKKPIESNHNKLGIFAQFIQLGLVMIVLDARKPAVVVPPEFSCVYDLSLNFSYHFELTDFAFDLRGVRATLSFDTGLFHCDIPWESVFGICSHTKSKQALWPEDLPLEIKNEPLKKMKNLSLVFSQAPSPHLNP